MRRALLASLIGAACTHPQAAPPRAHMTATQWTKQCSDRIEIARLALVPLDPAFADAKLDIDTDPSHPTVHFEARTGEAGIWWSNVKHGHHPCERVPPGFTDWRDNPSDLPTQVARTMRRDGDVAWLEANAVSPASALAFRREMERALAACVADARDVELAAVAPCQPGDGVSDE